MRGAAGVTIQPHQILSLSRRKTHLLNHHYIWNLIYNARSNRCHDPTSPNTAPVTQKDSLTQSSYIIITYETSFTMRGATGVTIQPHQILRLSRRKTRILSPHHIWKFTMRGATGVTIQPHQILRLSRRKTHILSPHHIWNVIYSARSNRCHDRTSPNTAPATQNCIAKFLTKSLKTGETSFPMRGRSEHDPRMIRAWSEHENANRNPPRKWGYFSRSPEAFSIVKYNVSSPILHSNIHQVLRLPQKVHIWNVIYTARSNRCHDPTSPNTAPVTQKDSHT